MRSPMLQILQTLLLNIYQKGLMKDAFFQSSCHPETFPSKHLSWSLELGALAISGLVWGAPAVRSFRIPNLG